VQLENSIVTRDRSSIERVKRRISTSDFRDSRFNEANQTQDERAESSRGPRDDAKRHPRHFYSSDYEYADSQHDQQALHRQRTEVTPRNFIRTPTLFSYLSLSFSCHLLSFSSEKKIVPSRSIRVIPQRGIWNHSRIIPCDFGAAECDFELSGPRRYRLAFGSIMIDTRMARNAKRTALYRFPPAETRFRSPAWQNEVPSLTYALSPARSKRTHFLPSPPPEIVESCLTIEFCVCFFQPRSTAADSSGHGTAVSSLSIHFLQRRAI